MLSAFLTDYVVWVFISALAVIQIAAAWSGLLGLLYARERPRATIAVSAFVVIVTLVWYFASDARNQPDTGRGLDANVQAFWFAVSSALAVGTTFAAASIVNHRWGTGHGWEPATGEAPPSGISWLSRTTFYHAIRARIRYARRTSADRVGV
jgi:hypothetical protein